MSTDTANESRKVEYRRLGKSGLRVSVPIFGAMGFGDPKYSAWMMSEDTALPLLKAAYDRGINTIDTSNLYSNGQSEIIIGKFLKKYKIPRQKIIILTKCYWLVSEDPSQITYLHQPEMLATPQYVNQGGLSRAAIFNQVEASLKRLQTDYIDLYQVHRFDYETPQEETMEALHDLVKMGKVRYIGASSMWAWQFQRFNYIAEKNGWTRFISMQCEYSLHHREEEREMIKYCNFEGIGLIPYHVLNTGHLARPLSAQTARKALAGFLTEPHTEADLTIMKRLEEVAAKKGWKMGQVALAWVGAKVASPIIGLSSVERMEEAIITGMTLTDEEMKYLEEPYQPKNIRFFV